MKVKYFTFGMKFPKIHIKNQIPDVVIFDLHLNLMCYTYEDRLNILKLTTLETRRIGGNLIEVFKMFKGFDNLDPLMFF